MRARESHMVTHLVWLRLRGAVATMRPRCPPSGQRVRIATQRPGPAPGPNELLWKRKLIEMEDSIQSGTASNLSLVVKLSERGRR